MESSNREPERYFSLSVCNQKGGVGKSTFTVLLASYLHYTVGYDVLVVSPVVDPCPARAGAGGLASKFYQKAFLSFLIS